METINLQDSQNLMGDNQVGFGKNQKILNLLMTNHLKHQVKVNW